MRSTRLPIAMRGCGSNVTTVGSRPESTVERNTDRWPRWTPSNVPIAAALGCRSTCEGARARSSWCRRQAERLLERQCRPSSASSTEKGPTVVRRSVTRWPPARPRWSARRCPTRRGGRARPRSRTSSSSWTRITRVGISTATPFRWRRYARWPAIFTADAVGIGSSTSPGARSAHARARCARRACATPPRRLGRRVAVPSTESISVTYRLSSFMKRSCRLVARPESSTRPRREQVRACRHGRSSRRCGRGPAPAIANDDGPAGLSARITPVGSSPFGIAVYATPVPLAPSNASTMRRVISSIARSVENPAARLCPPAEAPRDGRDVDAVRVRARALPRGGCARRELADERDELGAVDQAARR